MRGFAPKWYLIGIVGVCVYGFHIAIQGIKEQRSVTTLSLSVCRGVCVLRNTS